MRLFVVLLLPTLMAAPIWADSVVLKDGDRLEGIVTEKGDEVEIRMDLGTVSFAKSDVASIERGATLLSELEARAKKLKREDVEGHYRLGLEAEQRGLGSLARSLFREALEQSPEHKGARAALGYRLHEGRWLTEDEFMSSQGYLKRQGQWVTAEAARAIDDAEAKRRAVWEAERRRETDEKKIAALEKQVAEARAEAARAEERARAQPLYPSYVPVYGNNGYVVQQSSGFGISLTLGGPGGSVHAGVPPPPPPPSAAPAAPAPSPSPSPKPRVGRAR
jgi:hypothetical protein